MRGELLLVYAFNRPGDRVETLERHIMVGLHFLHEIYIKKNFGKHLALRLRIPKNLAEKILKITYALHDLGKAYNPYQQLIAKGKGAPGHEALSAYIVLKHLNITSNMSSKTEEHLRRGIAIAIILHHHAMRGWVEALNKLCNVAKQHKTTMYFLNNEAERTLTSIYAKLDITISCPKEIKVKNIVSTVLKEIQSIISKPLMNLNYRNPYKVTYTILHPLITCDVLAASTAKYSCNTLKCLNRIEKEIPAYVKEYLKTLKII